MSNHLVIFIDVCDMQAGVVGIPSTNILPGVRVPEVLRNSIAEKAGLKRGDIITRIAGEAVPAEPRAVANVVSIITCGPDTHAQRDL